MRDQTRESGQWFGITLSLWLVMALAAATGLTLIVFHFEHITLTEQIEALRSRVERLESAER